MFSISITLPDDWHVHLRDNDALVHTVAASARHFGRALVMPNLKPALTDLPSLLDYRHRILAARPENSSFMPMMTLYLNDKITAETLMQCKNYDFIVGAKLYPAGVTTNSSEGVSSLQRIFPLLEVMQNCDLVLQIHGETVEHDIFERETAFIRQVLTPLIKQFPRLRIVLEHISTEAAVDFITNAPQQVAATITPHHLHFNRNHLLAGGIKPHYYCLPILKKATDQAALQQAVRSGNPKFFAGTDSAPHAIGDKENACGCAGIYSAPYALALYAQIFDELNCLDKLNDFMSRNGADFYQVPYNRAMINLKKSPQKIPLNLPFATSSVVPMAAGDSLNWSVCD